VLGVAQGTRVITAVRDRASLEGKPAARVAIDGRQTLLLFEAGPGSCLAIPLTMVARLEEFQRSAVEFSGGQEVVRYRGQIMPLFHVDKYVSGLSATLADNDPMQVVVYRENDRSVGLVVGRIHDIVHEALTNPRHAHRNGIFGSVVIQDRVTDLLDVQSIIRAADPSFYPAALPVPTAA